MNEYKIYVAGSFVTTQDKLEVTNPYNNELIATTYLAGKKEIEIAISKGKEAEKDMRDLPLYKRYEILMQIAQAIKKDRLRLAEILAQESGKPLRYALGEIDRAAQTFLIAAEESKRLPGEYFSLDWTPTGHGKEALVKYFPVGLISGISPFNFPLNLAAHKIAPAIASGNPIILKPARATPLSILELAKIIDKTDLPKGSISLFPTNRESGNLLVIDHRIKKLTFTGSPEVGWKMKSEAGSKKITLELGGNAGVIVSADADISKAVEKCLVGSFAYSGQVCIHVQRIYVQDTVFKQFVDLFIKGTSKLKFGNPLDETTEISSMIDEENAIRVENWVNEAVSEGAKILSGGKRKGNYYEPTVITNTKSQMNVCALEIFGPVVTIEKYSSFKEAIALLNNSQFGLQAGVFSNNINEINYAFNELEVGGVINNDVPSFRVDHMPYGGVKNSGFGREGVKYSILEMMEPRLLVKDK
jgi:glyceraldehyde-3-phosphate dehydrogenase (NADP+)